MRPTLSVGPDGRIPGGPGRSHPLGSAFVQFGHHLSGGRDRADAEVQQARVRVTAGDRRIDGDESLVGRDRAIRVGSPMDATSGFGRLLPKAANQPGSTQTADLFVVAERQVNRCAQWPPRVGRERGETAGDPRLHVARASAEQQLVALGQREGSVCHG